MSHFADGAVSSSALAAAAVQASHGVLGDFISSHLVRLRQSWQHDSATGDLISFSMDGYGRPDWVMVMLLSDHRTSLLMVDVSVSTTGSICVASILQTASMGSLAATVTYAYEILALIASR